MKLLFLRALLALAALAAASVPVFAQGAASPSGAQGSGTGLTYVAIGASDGIGVGAENPGEGWVPRFAAALGPDTKVVDLAVYGTVAHAAAQDQLPAAVAASPDIVTVWLAVNDLNTGVPLSKYRADLDTILGTLATQTQAKVLVANIPDLSALPAYSGFNGTLLREVLRVWNATIADEAAKNGATLVDLQPYASELAAHPEYVAPDGFHPSAAGYARLADLFYAQVSSQVADTGSQVTGG